MNSLHKKIAELSLIRAIPLTVEGEIKNGRPRGILSRLARHVDKALMALPEVSKSETKKIIDRVSYWGELAGWRKSRHIATFASFALEIIENGDYPDNIRVDLIDLVDYFDRAKKVNTAPFWAGSLAYDKWVMVVDGEL